MPTARMFEALTSVHQDLKKEANDGKEGVVTEAAQCSFFTEKNCPSSSPSSSSSSLRRTTTVPPAVQNEEKNNQQEHHQWKNGLTSGETDDNLNSIVNDTEQEHLAIASSMLELIKFQQPAPAAPAGLPQRRECPQQEEQHEQEQQENFCNSSKGSIETITSSDLVPSKQHKHSSTTTDAPAAAPAASLEDKNSNVMQLRTSSSSSASFFLCQDDAHLRDQLAEYQRHQNRALGYYKNLMRREDECMYDRACSSSTSISSNKDYFSSSTLNQFKNHRYYNNGARPEDDMKTFETPSYPSSFRNIRHDVYGADEELLNFYLLHRHHHAAEIQAKRDPHLTITPSVNATRTPSGATHPHHMMQTPHSRPMSTSTLLPPCLPEHCHQVELETHQSRFNTLKLSPWNIHANPNPGAYSHMDPNRTFDGNSMNQYQMSKDTNVRPNSQLYHDQDPCSSSGSREQPFDLPNNNNSTNSHTVAAEISHSSERAQHKTFSLQKIYQALNRHVRGSNQDEYTKSKKSFLEGIRREGYISDLDRSNIKPYSRKRSSKESIEPTEYSSMTASSSIQQQQQSSYRERNVPTDILRAGSYSFAQSTRGSYSLNSAILKQDSNSTTGISGNHHYHPILTPQYREPVMLGMSTDADYISAFLQFLRAECCQVFTAGQDEVNERKKSKPVVMHQVGIRCAFCAHKPYSERASRSSCYPSSLDRIYQSIVMMVRDHFSVCHDFPPEVRKIYVSIKACRRRRDVDSRQYWAISARSLGISETDQGLFYLKM